MTVLFLEVCTSYPQLLKLVCGRHFTSYAAVSRWRKPECLCLETDSWATSGTTADAIFWTDYLKSFWRTRPGVKKHSHEFTTICSVRPLIEIESNAIRYMVGCVAVSLLKKYRKPSKNPWLQSKWHMFVCVLMGIKAADQCGEPESILEYTKAWSELTDRGGLYHINVWWGMYELTFQVIFIYWSFLGALPFGISLCIRGTATKLSLGSCKFVCFMFLGHEAMIHIQIYALCRSTCTKHDVVNLCVSRSLSPEVWGLGPHVPPLDSSLQYIVEHICSHYRDSF